MIHMNSLARGSSSARLSQMCMGTEAASANLTSLFAPPASADVSNREALDNVGQALGTAAQVLRTRHIGFLSCHKCCAVKPERSCASSGAGLGLEGYGPSSIAAPPLLVLCWSALQGKEARGFQCAANGMVAGCCTAAGDFGGDCPW